MITCVLRQRRHSNGEAETTINDAWIVAKGTRRKHTADGDKRRKMAFRGQDKTCKRSDTSQRWGQKDCNAVLASEGRVAVGGKGRAENGEERLALWGEANEEQTRPWAACGKALV
ncbi:hypothetical protein TRVL_05391 [Trypanosoma vivax]|nr:hypothetical protein TRVL_05391 [Trypanosoma vivax]